MSILKYCEGGQVFLENRKMTTLKLRTEEYKRNIVITGDKVYFKMLKDGLK